MRKFLRWIDGKKTYIVSVGVIVYAALATRGIVPKPEQTADWLYLVAAYAVTLRSTLRKFYDRVKED